VSVCREGHHNRLSGLGNPVSSAELVRILMPGDFPELRVRAHEFYAFFGAGMRAAVSGA